MTEATIALLEYYLNVLLMRATDNGKVSSHNYHYFGELLSGDESQSNTNSAY
ncbi:MAG: hypothetical protein QS748_05065 [Candidatus Endonucleobacter bathymodioli]|uniref:Uncharacterized protein n=1 Tax=Candidatus Endonucleibacter bathymodioli TaxID=539814 RepID=A0AA90NL31_9GAMM|nr:hypothetical protein [Candidatus Endonucleobacter bathymodioli]